MKHRWCRILTINRTFEIVFSTRTSRRSAHLDNCSRRSCLLSGSRDTIFHFAWDCLSTGQLGHASKADVFRLARTTYFFAILGASDCHHMVSLSVRILRIFYKTLTATSRQITAHHCNERQTMANSRQVTADQLPNICVFRIVLLPGNKQL